MADEIGISRKHLIDLERNRAPISRTITLAAAWLHEKYSSRRFVTSEHIAYWSEEQIGAMQ